MADQKGTSSATIASPAAASPSGKASKACAVPRPLSRNQVTCYVLTMSVTLLAVSIAALSTGWFIAHLTTQSPSAPSTTMSFELQVQSVVVTLPGAAVNATSNSFTYDELTLPDTKQIMLASRGFTIVVLVANLLLALLVMITLNDDVKQTLLSSTIVQEVYCCVPMALAALSVFFSVAAVVVHVGIIRTMYRDDILRQITAGAMSCVVPAGSTALFDCRKFWTDATHVVGAGEVLDNHHPYTGFWLMGAAALVSMYLFHFVRTRREVVTMREEFALARRQSAEEKGNAGSSAI